MRAIIQRVSQASVEVEGEVVGAIGAGLLVLLGVGVGDGEAEASLLAEKTAQLRIFADEGGRFDRSLIDIGGAALVVSQFTLYADTRKGRRPSFTDAAPPEIAAPLVQAYAAALRALGIPVESGVFGASMRVALVNDGPVTISLDSAALRLTRR
ncbi:D-tyrosyl-tRNA(Tyr) deacylase [Oscillochloris sp. ZM17-4]|uniref:D-aminoacyl-tRNA deacylase n=1 Tax=Oscillochloris sp. ZM17-4 TaxID=2866714 RepID=UPI001C7367FF|nr:D-aminoacyl-tRNA deacylase [Oscillochloris sp. ZM17-4]MBX0328954.1 D-tyrosyl-tRNA(Tyr) deacylase [Oscillochloris sp. ZM17-4]